MLRDSFKRADCWGYTRDEAKGQLVAHLVNSSHHYLDPEEADLIAETADYKEGSNWQGVQVQPKKRPAPPRSPPPVWIIGLI